MASSRLDLDSLLRRITVRSDVFGGKPIIRDLRISVELIVSLLAQGVTVDAILDDYPALEPDDVRACLAGDPGDANLLARSARLPPRCGHAGLSVAGERLTRPRW